MKDTIQIPIAYCRDCKRDVPVVIELIKGHEWNLEGITSDMTIIYCPNCNTLLNMLGDVEVKYFTPEELIKAGWVVGNVGQFDSQTREGDGDN